MNTMKRRTKKIRTKPIPWTKEELDALNRQFCDNYRTLTTPRLEQCVAAKKQEPALQRRDWKSIKFRVHHELQKLRKKK